jgi:hypothetical protein
MPGQLILPSCRNMSSCFGIKFSLLISPFKKLEMKKSLSRSHRSWITIFALLIILLFGFCEHETKSKKLLNDGNDH